MSKRITGKLNLLQLYAIRKMMNGESGQVECLVIPIVKNKLFIGEKGIYLDLIGFEIEKPAEGQKDTHLVKQSFSKEDRTKMSEAELKAIPVLGNLRIWEGSDSESTSSMGIQVEEDDLPFN